MTAERQPPKPSPSFTSWKLNVQAAACADPRIPPTHFRMFVRVLAALNENTRVAVISDDVIADEVPGFKVQSTCYRARQRLQELGYWEFDAGRGSRATHYKISDEPVPAIMSAIEHAREMRIEEREKRNGTLKKRSPNHAAVQGKSAPEADQSAEAYHAAVQGYDRPQPCKSLSPNHAAVQVVHPQHTPSGFSLPSPEESQSAHTQESKKPLECADCGSHANLRWGVHGGGGSKWGYCDACAEIEIASGGISLPSQSGADLITE